MSTVTIEEAAKNINAAANQLKGVVSFIEGVAYGDDTALVQHPTDPSKKLPSIEKMVKDGLNSTQSRIEVWV